jgi:transcriptional regulator with XRE-family HTH domain
MLHLRLFRVASRLTLLEVQLKSGVTATRLSLAERGLITLTPKDQGRVAKVLNADPERLFAEVVPSTLGKAQQVEAVV